MLRSTATQLLTYMEQALQRLPRDVSTEAAVEENTAFLTALAKIDGPKRLIEEVLRDREALSRVASASYRHANGFHKILLLGKTHSAAYRLSIHHWYRACDESSAVDEPIHNHRFSFWSHIVRGTMRASFYTECNNSEEGGTILPRYRYLPMSTGNIHTCKYDGNARLKQSDSKTYLTGEVYYLNYMILHRVHAPENGERVCTLVLRGPRERDYAETYNTSYAREGIDYNTPVMQPDELGVVLMRILGSR